MWRDEEVGFFMDSLGGCCWNPPSVRTRAGRSAANAMPSVLVNNAGLFPLASLDVMDPVAFEQTMQANLIAPFYVLIIILMFKPYGLFGTKDIERI